MDNINSEKKACYEKTTALIFSLFKVFRRGCLRFVTGSNLTDRQMKILTKEYGNTYSKDNILFAEKFLVFAPTFLATCDSIRYYGFEKDALKKGVLNLRNIKSIQYSLMPLHTWIKITTNNGQVKTLYDGVPNAESYSDVKSYNESVQKGTYKAYTACLLFCVYALTALSKCKQDEYSSKYSEILKNATQLAEYLRAGSESSKFYGDFLSFDFVTCQYNARTVENALDRIDEAMEEAKAEASAERRERIAEAAQNTMERSFQRIEKEKQRVADKYNE